jgi:hypothetical protein
MIFLNFSIFYLLFTVKYLNLLLKHVLAQRTLFQQFDTLCSGAVSK